MKMERNGSATGHRNDRRCRRGLVSLRSRTEASSSVDILACSRPVPYDCVVKPRFPEVESILAEERERFGI